MTDTRAVVLDLFYYSVQCRIYFKTINIHLQNQNLAQPRQLLDRNKGSQKEMKEMSLNTK